MWRGFDVKFVQNVTDVDDKIIAKSLEEGRSAAEVAAEYTEAFIEDMRRANVLDPVSYTHLDVYKRQGVDRVILSGIHAYYEPEELAGRTLIAITNLPPRKMMGIESCGMLLSAIHEAVSYTHLDVYKRQASRCSPWVSPPRPCRST